MKLKQLIDFLERQPQDKIISIGFCNPHSYRGYYDELAFEVKKDITVAQMLSCAKEALNKPFEGYKGGNYTMTEDTNCHLACYGEGGAELTGSVLGFLFFDWGHNSCVEDIADNVGNFLKLHEIIK